MRLRVEVLAERRPIAGGRSREGGNDHNLSNENMGPNSAYQVMQRFNLPVKPEQTFEEVWRNLESRYGRSYLSDAQAA